MDSLLFAITLLASQVLALVNGKPITREDVEAALGEGGRQEYHDSVADLRDYEHASVRDFLGRQALDRMCKEMNLPPDSVYARVLANDFDKFDPNLRNRVQQQRERVYKSEHAALEDLIQQRLFETAAKAKGMTPEQLTRSLGVQAPPVTKSDLDFIKAYESIKLQASATVAPGDGRLEAAIRGARIEQMRQSLIAGVTPIAKPETMLPPPRVAVSTVNASVVGSPTAPVHVVIFTDFECPYCRESEATITTLREKYGNRIALYYLNYPLPTHEHAMPAAHAAAAAAAQGKYLAYHDVLFAHQQDLAHPDFGGWAATAGLDRAAFEKYLATDAPKRRVEADIREGIAAGVAGTPTFLVNGRLVVDNETLTRIVEEELAATK